MMIFSETQNLFFGGAAEIGLVGINGLFLFATFFLTEQVCQADNK